MWLLTARCQKNSTACPGDIFWLCRALDCNVVNLRLHFCIFRMVTRTSDCLWCFIAWSHAHWEIAQFPTRQLSGTRNHKATCQMVPGSPTIAKLGIMWFLNGYIWALASILSLMGMRVNGCWEIVQFPTPVSPLIWILVMGSWVFITTSQRKFKLNWAISRMVFQNFTELHLDISTLYVSDGQIWANWLICMWVMGWWEELIENWNENENLLDLHVSDSGMGRIDWFACEWWGDW